MATNETDRTNETYEDLDAEYAALVAATVDDLDDEREDVVDESTLIKVEWIPGVGLVDKL